MRNQWFGDISDYYKYGLLRLISERSSLKIGVCWMLTRNERTKYLHSREDWRKYDPDLYDFLKSLVSYCEPCNISKVKAAGIIPNCQFYPDILEDKIEARKQYFDKLKDEMQACDLLFFDADNGVEVDSVRFGQNGSSRYLYWREIEELYGLGHSILVFQHHRQRVKHDDLIESLRSKIESLRSKSFDNRGISTYFYRTKYVTFLLIAQSKHQATFQELNKTVEARWQKEIQVVV